MSKKIRDFFFNDEIYIKIIIINLIIVKLLGVYPVPFKEPLASFHIFEGCSSNKLLGASWHQSPAHVKLLNKLSPTDEDFYFNLR